MDPERIKIVTLGSRPGLELLNTKDGFLEIRSLEGGGSVRIPRVLIPTFVVALYGIDHRVTGSLAAQKQKGRE